MTEIKAQLPACERCGADTESSRTYSTPNPQNQMGHWAKRVASCQCGHEFDIWETHMEIPQPRMVHGVIKNVGAS